MGLGGEGEGFGGVLEGDDGLDGEVEFAGEHQVGEGGEGVEEGFRSGGFEPAADPEAAEVEVFEDEEGVGDFEAFEAHGAVGDEGAAGGEEVHEADGAVATDGVGGESDRGGAESFPGGSVAFGVVGEDGGGALGFEFWDEIGAADEGEGANTEGGGDLDEGAADGGVAGVLSYPVAFEEGDEFFEKEPGGDGIDAEHGGLGEVDAGGEEGEELFWSDHVLGPGADAEKGNDVVANGEGGDFGADGFDDA